MKYSIIIPCYNEVDNIDNLIKKIKPLQDNYDLEYILVENGSQDNSRAYFKSNVEGKYPNIKIVYVDKNQGYGYGIQQGLKSASGDYIGWIHADLQVSPNELAKYFDETQKHALTEKLFIKAVRTNRSAFDMIFTNGQSVFSSLLFCRRIYDVGSVPVLFSRVMLSDVNIEDMPNDFSIDLYVYIQAKKLKYKEIRIRVAYLKREGGNSSWNRGFSSKVRQSTVIMKDSIKIKKGQKVL